jgi:undecaprenyl-diphosphatase
MAEARNPLADRIARTLHAIGGTFAMTAVVVVGAVLLMLRREWRLSVSLVTSLVASSGASNLLKGTVRRTRPEDAVLEDAKPAFPSGHATSAGALGAAIVLIAPRGWVVVLALVWAAAMAWSRAYLLVHWLSDTVAGVLMGASIAVLVHRAIHRVPPP